MTAPEARIVHVEKPVYGGAFLARLEGKAAFVPLVLPGETASVRVAKENKSFVFAEAEKIITTAPQRISAACHHFGTCGGCHYQHADYSAQLAFKQAILGETMRRAGVRPPEAIAMLAAEPWAYRNRIRLALDAHGNAGYRARRSSTIVPISECPIAAPVLLHAARVFHDLVSKTSPALLPAEVTLFCNAGETELLVSFITSNAAKWNLGELCMAASKQIPALKGAEHIIEDRRSGKARMAARWGTGSLTYRAAGFDYRVDHGAFFQVNRHLVDALADEVTAGHRGALAWDLFAGVGLFARRLSTSFGRVIAVESAPAATGALAANLDGTPGKAVHADTLAFLRGQRGNDRPDFVVVDPPRAGLSAEAATLLAEIAPPAITYVSCDPATLARDLRVLTSTGYAIESLVLADLFPQTFHIEALVRLRRA